MPFRRGRGRENVKWRRMFLAHCAVSKGGREQSHLEGLRDILDSAVESFKGFLWELCVIRKLTSALLKYQGPLQVLPVQ